MAYRFRRYKFFSFLLQPKTRLSSKSTLAIRNSFCCYSPVVASGKTISCPRTYLIVLINQHLFQTFTFKRSFLVIFWSFKNNFKWGHFILFLRKISQLVKLVKGVSFSLFSLSFNESKVCFKGNILIIIICLH